MLTPTKPTSRQWRPNILIFGASGTGKTKTWLDLVKLTGARALVFDTHHGTDAWAASYPTGWEVVHSSSPEELDDQIDHYCARPGNFSMFVVDDISVVHVEQQDIADDELRPLKQMRDRTVGKFGAVLDPGARAQVSRMNRVALNKLTHLDMARVVVARCTPKYRPRTDGKFFEQDGWTFSGDKEMPYSFDMVMHLETYGQRRVAVIEKARGMPTFPATIEEFDAAKLLAQLPCGRAGFTDPAKPEPLISAEQVAELRSVFAEAALEPGRQSRALNHFGATSIKDVPAARYHELMAALRTVIDSKKPKSAPEPNPEEQQQQQN